MTTETLEKPDTMASAEKSAMTLGHATPAAPRFVKGRRDFFQYRDLGVTAASDGKVRAQVMSTITGMTEPTGWHYHVCDGQFIYTLKGWVELEFADGSEYRLEAGDSLFIPGNMPHNEMRTSDDLELLELSVPADMGTKTCPIPESRANRG